MDDIRAVMDDAGIGRAVLWTASTSTGIAVLFAATYPDRCAGLVRCDPRPTGTRSVDYPWAPTEEEWRRAARRGSGRLGRAQLPRDARATNGRPRWPTMTPFATGSSGTCAEASAPVPRSTSFRAAMEVDVRDVLGAVRVPTLVLPTPRDAGCRPLHRRAHPRTREVSELPELRGFYTWVDDDAHAATMEATGRFIDRLRAPATAERILATILFTDIVGSTERAARLGDAAWHDLLQRHHAVVRTELAQFGGRELDTAGDGFFASFDGPARAVTAAAAIRDALRPLDMEIRAGLHTGECSVSDGKLAGIAVSVGARITHLAGPGEVLVSSTVKDLVARLRDALRRPRHARPQRRAGRVARVRARLTHGRGALRTVPGCPRRSRSRRPRTTGSSAATAHLSPRS